MCNLALMVVKNIGLNLRYFLVLTALLPNVVQKSESIRQRVLGGRPVHPGEFQMLAQIFQYPEASHVCGGVIITHQIVLSVAKCFITNDELMFNNRKVMVGDIHRNTDTPSESRQIILIDELIHPEGYEDDKSNKNIVLVKLKWSIRFSDVVRPTRIARGRPAVGAECIACGWGATEDEPNSEVLVAAPIPIQDNEKCQESLKEFNQEFMLCAGDENRQNGTCYGDQGGPLLCNGKVSGLIYFGKQFCFGEAAYVDVSAFFQWISEHSNDHHRTYKKKNGCTRLVYASLNVLAILTLAQTLRY